MYLFTLIEMILRFILGTWKPIGITGTPPGLVFTFILTPYSIFMLYLSLGGPFFLGSKSSKLSTLSE